MTADFLSGLLRHDRAVVLGGLLTVAASAWIYLLLGAGLEMQMMDMGGGQMMAMSPEWTLGYGTLIFGMWAVMMVAMMLPSAAPAILLVTALDRQRGVTGAWGRSALFASGYLLVWFGFSLAATLLQAALAGLGLLSETMAASNRAVAGGVVVAAGLYQWTPLKNACLAHCRSPIFDRSHCGAGLDRKDAALGWTDRPDHRPRAGRLGRLGAIADELTFTANLSFVHSSLHLFG
jgi:predicted metal-binding membrane protein